MASGSIWRAPSAPRRVGYVDANPARACGTRVGPRLSRSWSSIRRCVDRRAGRNQEVGRLHRRISGGSGTAVFAICPQLFFSAARRRESSALLGFPTALIGSPVALRVPQAARGPRERPIFVTVMTCCTLTLSCPTTPTQRGPNGENQSRRLAYYISSGTVEWRGPNGGSLVENCEPSRLRTSFTVDVMLSRGKCQILMANRVAGHPGA